MEKGEFITLRALHTKQTLDLKAYKSTFGDAAISISTTDLFIQTSPSQYCLICNYGVLVFYDCDEDDMDDVLDQLGLPEYSRLDKVFTDEYEVTQSNDNLEATFNHIALPKSSPTALRIIMLNLAQSLALQYYDHVSQLLLSNVRQFTAELENKGRLSIKDKEIMRFVGRALNTQNKIAENLYIFDAPPDTWEDEFLEKVNRSLSKHFELGSRYRSIDNTLKIIQANLSAFMELSHHKENSRLEWIIIVLILVEVIDTMLAKVT
jgi:uncharacterized Rmd1/YagE family protein